MVPGPSSKRLVLVAVFALAAGLTGLSGQQAPPPPPPPPPSPPAGITTTAVTTSGGTTSFFSTTSETGGRAVEQSGTGVIAGRVVEASTNQPLSGVVVMVGGGGPALPVPAGSAPSGPARPPTPRILSDNEGRFVFRNLPPGSFLVTATLAGYADGRFGRVRPSGPGRPIELRDGERRLGLTVPMVRLSAITGRVVDDLGEPAVGTTIQSYRRTIVAGGSRLSPMAQAVTDDRGVYRLSGLVPGDYVVCARFTTGSVPVGFSSSPDFLATVMAPGASGYSVRSGGARVAATDRFLLQTPGGALDVGSESGAEAMTFASVCNPSSPTVSGGTAVRLDSGSERAGVDLTIRLVPARTISGQLSGPDGSAANFVLHLVPSDSGALSADPDVATAVTADDGAFMFLNVPSGEYVIQTVRVPRPTPLGRGAAVGLAGGGRGAAPATATGPTVWTATPVSVGDSDVAGLSVVLSEGATFSGRVEFDGAADRPQPAALSSISILVDSADGKPRANAPLTRVGQDGGFITGGYPAGRYFVRAAGGFGNWFLRSVTFGGVDISDAGVDLRGNDLAGIVITFTDRATRLSGNVSGIDPDRDAVAVLAFPASTGGWIGYGLNPRRMRYARVLDGGFTFAGLPPGDYFLVAVDEAIVEHWQDPKFLAALAQVADRVTVAEGDQISRQIGRVTVKAPEPSPLGAAPPIVPAPTGPEEPHGSHPTAGPFVDEQVQSAPVREAPRSVTTGTASISGVVLSDDSASAPVRRAKVTLRGGQAGVEFSVLTGEDGRWRIQGLPAGRYTAVATKAAYLNSTYGAKRPGQSPGSAIAVTDGEAVTGITLKMSRGAVIAGRVVDEAGRPVPGIGVRAAQIQTTGGNRRLVYAGIQPGPGGSPFGLQTDDLGQYRIYGLSAGSYVVGTATAGPGIRPPFVGVDIRTVSAEDLRAASSGDATGSAVSAANTAAAFTPMGGRPVGYAPIYFPSALLVDEAIKVDVAAGEERNGVDISMRLVPMAVVSGVVMGADGEATGLRLQLITTSSGGISSGGVSMSTLPVGPDGSFSTRPLAPGRYTLSASGGPGRAGGPPPASAALTHFAEMDIEVRGDDLSGVTLTLQPGATVTGRVVFQGDLPPPDPASVRVSLSSADPERPMLGKSATVSPDWTFAITGVPPGLYSVGATAIGSAPPGGRWLARSAVYQGRDAIDAPLEVQAGQEVDGVAVTMAERLAEVSGTLTDAKGRAIPDLTMVLFSVDRANWRSGSRRVQPPQRPDSAGRYLFPNVIPGEYFLAAVADIEPASLADPAFLEAVAAGAIRISVGERERKVQDLRVAGG